MLSSRIVLRTCSVSYKDMDGVTHTVEVTASSLYEAAVLGMKAFEQSGWVDDPVGCMEITVKSPAVRPRVPVAQVTNWPRSAGSLREAALLDRTASDRARLAGRWPDNLFARK
jgi:hypothetical protein